MVGTLAVVVAPVVLTVGLLVVLTGGIALALVRRTTATRVCFGENDQPLSRRRLVRIGVLCSSHLVALPQQVSFRPDMWSR
jgi:hypothetical protein